MSRPTEKANRHGHDDTSPKARAYYWAHLRSLSAVEKAAIVTGLTRSTWDAVEASLRHKFPGASDREILERMSVRIYGPKIAGKLQSLLRADR